MKLLKFILLFVIIITGNRAYSQQDLYGIWAKRAPYSFSFGDAPISYKQAIHHLSPHVRLGDLGLNELQTIPEHSLDANTSKNDNGIVVPYTGNYVDLASSDFKLDASGNLTAKVKVHNATNDIANVIGWIDFNHNGEFDGASEASVIAPVAANTIAATATVNLVWNGALSKLSNGRTYMRLRITTDNMSNTQPTGLFFNGEVEDYKLVFNILEIEKTVAPVIADIGDTVTYTIKVKNNTAAPIDNIKLFDPIPEYTSYINGSAKKGVNPSGAKQTEIINGNNVEAIVWPLFNLAGNTTSDEYSFKVVITERPANGIIPNVAYIPFNSDTITSVGAACYFAEVTVNNLKANKDYFAVFKNDSILYAAISLNDTDPSRNFVRDTILTVKHGTAELNMPKDGTLKYNTLPNYLGLDSIDYRIKTANDSADTKAYIAVVTTEATQYVACPGAEVTITMLPKNDLRITYTWYKTQTGGISFASGASVPVKIGNNDTSIYVEVLIDGNIATPRLPVTVFKSNTCGGTAVDDCITDGTVIFSEDFGGNAPAHPNYKPTPIAECTIPNYTTGGTLPDADYYTITKIGATGFYTWRTGTVFDNTHNGDYAATDTVGYYLLARIKGYLNGTPQQFFEKELTNLCEGTKLYFSVYALNYNDVTQINPGLSRPILRFELLDNANNIIASYVTGKIEVKADWTQYGFPFEVPAGVSSLKLRITNEVESRNGGDMGIALDDIEVRLCVPLVELNITDTAVCAGTKLDITGTYEDDGTFGEDLTYRWEFKKKNTTNWVPLEENDVTVTAGDKLIKTWTIDPIKKEGEGYYRMLVSATGNISSINCTAASDSVYVKARIISQVPDIRIQVCPSPGRQIHLTSFLDSLDFDKVKWEKISTASPDFALGTDITTGEINSGDLTSLNMYKYTLASECGSSFAKVYVSRLTDKIHKSVDTIVVCRAQEMNRYIQLNQILGLELNGTWAYDQLSGVNHDNVVKDNVEAIAAPSKYAGALIFNAFKASETTNTLYTKPYNGDANAKEFKFKYTTSADCGGVKNKEFIIIITDKML